jgi:uncharacterized membrane protein YqaE (UPF0057 family)
MKRQILIEFQGNKFFLDFITSKILNDNKINDINNFCFTSIQQQLKYRYGLHKEDYYLSTRTKLVSLDWDFLNNEESYYIVNLKVNGGFIALLRKLVNGIIKIVKVVTSKMPAFFMWLVDMFVWVITEVLNPLKFFQDLARGIITVIKTFIMAFVDLISGMAKYVVNGIFTPIVAGFWGYTPARERNTFCIISSAKKNDNFLIIKKSKNKFDNIFPTGTKVIIQSNNDSKFQIVTVMKSEIDTGTDDTGTTKVSLDASLNSKYTAGSTMSKPGKYGTGVNKGNCGKKKCISISNSISEIKTDILGEGKGIGSGISLSLPEQQGKLPISIIITTIFLPPLGLFMELGFKGWLNIAICALLTLFFYFPGLIYALIILYC